MIVHDNRKEKTINFGDIEWGENFYDSHNDIHAKKVMLCADGVFNAISLSTGDFLCYEDDYAITPTKAKIEIYE